MDYKKIYDDIVNRGKSRVLTGYSETHHIIPRCLGGTDDHENLVRLTPEEHYVCHLLLAKIYAGDIRLVKAAMYMSVSNERQLRNNKMYGWIRRKYSEYMKGPKNPTKLNGPWNKGVSGYKNRVNFSDESLEMFSSRMREYNPCAGLKAWNHPRATDYSRSIWSNADLIYDVWVGNNRPSYCRLHRLVRGETYTSKTIGPFMNIVKYFRDGWVPTEDAEWVEFKRNFKEGK